MDNMTTVIDDKATNMSTTNLIRAGIVVAWLSLRHDMGSVYQITDGNYGEDGNAEPTVIGTFDISDVYDVFDEVLTYCNIMDDRGDCAESEEIKNKIKQKLTMVCYVSHTAGAAVSGIYNPSESIRACVQSLASTKVSAWVNNNNGSLSMADLQSLAESDVASELDAIVRVMDHYATKG